MNCLGGGGGGLSKCNIGTSHVGKLHFESPDDCRMFGMSFAGCLRTSTYVSMEILHFSYDKGKM